MYLTKSDFAVARTCATKLYYKKLQYPSLNDEDPYLEFLADGGYMVEKMAKLVLGEGKELGHWDDPAQAFAETCRALEAGHGTFFEATVIHGGLLARIDILSRDEKVLRLIEVKSSSIDSSLDGPNPFRGKKGGISSEWMPYLEDVTFQTIVLRRAFPHFRVVPFLCVVDKAKSATANATFDKFRLRRESPEEKAWGRRVDYVGDVGALRKEHILAVLDVSAEVEDLKTEVEGAAEEFAASLASGPVTRISPELGKKCKYCEYRLPQSRGGKNGFHDCWGRLAEPEPHALDLYRVDLLGGKNRDVVAELAAKGCARLSDLPAELLSGAAAARQRLQIEYTATGLEYIAPALRELLSAHEYPLHFIDFEGSRLAVPYHAGMRPYEEAAFQWSCHTIRAPGGAVEHAEWLNTEEAFPNFAFARALRDQLGTKGTVYIWSHYEIAILREIRHQMEKYACGDSGLAGWLEGMTSPGGSRVVDLCALAKDYYFHPAMKGSLSIKQVLPAVWGADANLRKDPLFQNYVKHDGHGTLLDPYAALPPLPIGETEEVVKEGTGAMRVYQELMFGRAKDDAGLRDTYRKLLFQYCELDTAAMVMIWIHWTAASA